jgi:hypothetical protein
MENIRLIAIYSQYFLYSVVVPFKKYLITLIVTDESAHR